MTPMNEQAELGRNGQKIFLGLIRRIRGDGMLTSPMRPDMRVKYHASVYRFVSNRFVFGP